MNRQRSDESGFTLLEILMAVVIFAVIMTTLFSSFRAFILSGTHVKNELVQTEKITGMFNRINSDLDSVFCLQPPRYRRPEFDSQPDPYQFAGNRETVGQTVFSFLVFTSLAHAGFNRDNRFGIARIAYYVKENRAGTYDLYRSDVLAPYPDEIQSCRDAVLCKDISGFEITYTDRDGNEYKFWDSEDQTFKFSFPQGIEFKIFFGDEEPRQVFTLPVSLTAGRPSLD